MGIQGLMKLITEECPGCVKEQELDNFTGRRIAIDASMAMYQFLIAVRQMGSGGNSTQLTNEAGEVTSHIQGMFNRTIRLMSSGIKPVYVFDGKPPQMKGGELAKRMARRAKAESELAAAKDSGDAEEVDKYSRRLVKVTKQHNEDCKQLLRLMGVPVVEAPCEAESQCAELAKHGKVYGAATEDMDALTFRTPKLLRKMTFSGTKQPILEIDCELMLTGLGLTYPEFIDLCILCGCDYTESIKGIGPKTALKLIRQYKNIESVIKALKKTKKHEIPEDWKSTKILKETVEIAVKDVVAPDANNETAAATVESKDEAQSEVPPDAEAVPDIEAEAVVEDKDDDLDWSELEKSEEEDDKAIAEAVEEDVDMSLYDIIPPMYEQARNLFVNADVTPAASISLNWEPPNEEELRRFLVEKMGFNEDRVNSGIKKLVEAQAKKAQKRMDSFFSVVPQDAASRKRKLEIANKQALANSKNKKGGKSGFAGKKR